LSTTTTTPRRVLGYYAAAGIPGSKKIAQLWVERANAKPLGQWLTGATYKTMKEAQADLSERNGALVIVPPSSVFHCDPAINPFTGAVMDANDATPTLTRLA
jgi:hypothetical protein